jgi:hypothetical protein
MPDKRSSLIYDQYQKASQQFDYLVTGATGALCTYIVQTFKPKRIDASPYTLELLALAVLILSVILGFKMIESKVTGLAVNAAWLQSNERAGALTAALSNVPFGGGVNADTGEVITGHNISGKIATAQASSEQRKSELDKWARRSLRLYKWRNRTLAFGFVLLVVARLASPYWPYQPPAPQIQLIAPSLK